MLAKNYWGRGEGTEKQEASHEQRLHTEGSPVPKQQKKQDPVVECAHSTTYAD